MALFAAGGVGGFMLGFDPIMLMLLPAVFFMTMPKSDVASDITTDAAHITNAQLGDMPAPSAPRYGSAVEESLDSVPLRG